MDMRKILADGHGSPTTAARPPPRYVNRCVRCEPMGCLNPYSLAKTLSRKNRRLTCASLTVTGRRVGREEGHEGDGGGRRPGARGGRGGGRRPGARGGRGGGGLREHARDTAGLLQRAAEAMEEERQAAQQMLSGRAGQRKKERG
jgi:hypothetical protein